MGQELVTNPKNSRPTFFKWQSAFCKKQIFLKDLNMKTSNTIFKFMENVYAFYAPHCQLL